MTNTIKRGLFHILGGLLAALCGLFLPRVVFLICLGTATFILLAAELARFMIPRLNTWFCRHFASLIRDTEVTRVTGATYLAIGALITFLAPFEKNVAVVAISFLAVGDPMGSMIGKQVGKLKFRGKTAEGCTACLAASVAVALIYYFSGLDIRLLAVLIGAAVATITEALELPINDNLAIPLSSGVIMTLLQL